MAVGATEFVDKTIADGVFSPDKWSKQVLRATEANLVFAKKVNRAFEADASVGRTVKVASIGNLADRAKVENTAITFETIAETATTITLNIWRYAAVGIESIVDLQSNVPLRNEYEAKMGYAVAKGMDDLLADDVAGLSQAIGTLGTPFTDDNVRRGVRYLDDADAPENNRCLVLSPAEKDDKLALDKWTNSLYRGSTKQVNRGDLGEVYGLQVAVTTNINKPAASQADNTIMHKEAIGLVVQRDPKPHAFYDVDFFTWKLAVEMIYGHQEMRDAFGVWLKGQS